MPSRARKKPSEPRVAIVCDFLTDIGGAEKVVFAMAKLFPDAPVYTLLFDPKRIAPFLDPARVRPAPLGGVPRFMRRNRFRRYLLGKFPRAIEAIDLSEYDIVVSSSNSYAKGVITKPETLHISYCHSPTRYLWDWHAEYLREQKLHGLKLRVVQWLTTNLRQWDVLASERVDRFLANSKTVQQRIAKYYRRESTVLYPPVAIPELAPSSDHAGYFLVVSRLEPYKRIDLVVKAFARMKDHQLVVIGDGWQRAALQKMATENVEFLGYKDDATVQAYIQGARGVIFAGEDDFGIVPVEAMAAGTPVIAYGKGGALETVIEGVTGTFFYEPTPKDVKEAVLRLIAMEHTLNAKKIRARAEEFSEAVFATKLRAFVEKAWAEYRTR